MDNVKSGKTDKLFAAYFRRNKRITKSLLGAPTTPLTRIALLRLVDFLVKMWRLKGFWKEISPVPVTLKRFLALELVFTFGIFNNLVRLHPAGVPEQTGLLLSHMGNGPYLGLQR